MLKRIIYCGAYGDVIFDVVVVLIFVKNIKYCVVATVMMLYTAIVGLLHQEGKV